MDSVSKLKKVLFVCIENSCRSQIAEAFAKILGNGIIDVYSSGSRPSGKVNEKAIVSMKAIGYDLTLHKSKSLQDIPQIQYDHAVTMGCGDECPYVKSKNRQNWDIPDPKNMNESDFNRVRDIIENKVLHLINEIKDKAKQEV